MVTKDEALTVNDFHYTGNGMCQRIVGPRGGIKELITHVRRSGVTQLWKRDLQRFRVPVKYGMYESYEITNDNAALWHSAKHCPLDKKE